MSVVTYFTNTPTCQLPATQMSICPIKMTTGQEILKKVVEKFIGCWGVQWEAFLSLPTEDGEITLAFSTNLRHPSTPLNPYQLIVLMLQLANIWLLDL